MAGYSQERPEFRLANCFILEIDKLYFLYIIIRLIKNTWIDLLAIDILLIKLDHYDVDTKSLKS